MNTSLEIFRMQRLAGLLTESQYSNLLLFEDEIKQVQKLEKELEDEGKDLDDPKIAADVLDKFIDSDFKAEKINIKSIKEIEFNLEESAAAGGFITSAIGALENVEVINVLATKLGFSKAKIGKIKTALQKVARIANVPFRLIEKAFYKLAKIFGFSIESSKIAGIGGLTLFAILLFSFGVTHLPGLIAGAATIKGFFLLIGGIMKVGSAIISFFKNIGRGKKEKKDKFYTTADFFTDIETHIGKDVPTKVVYQFSDWIDTYKDDKETYKDLSNLLKSIQQKVKGKKGASIEIDKISSINKQDDNAFTKEIDAYLNQFR
jgi:hypothetical protein